MKIDEVLKKISSRRIPVRYGQEDIASQFLYGMDDDGVSPAATEMMAEFPSDSWKLIGDGFQSIVLADDTQVVKFTNTYAEEEEASLDPSELPQDMVARVNGH